MSKRKPRVLWCGEASFLHTGYAVYARQVLTRLYKTNKYEIAELACYASHASTETETTPWTVYHNMPDTEEEEPQYVSNSKNQFG